jgi:hypothetical protein
MNGAIMKGSTSDALLGLSRHGSQLLSRKLAQTFGVFTESSLEFFQHGLEVFRFSINSFGAEFADAVF